MARNCVRYGACVLLAAAAVVTGCSTGSSNMVNAGSPTTTASISATSYDFGQNIVGNPETQTVVEVTNTGTNPLTLNPTIVGSTAGFTVVAAQSCGTTLAAASSCPILITYAPTTAGSQTATLNLGLANVPLPLAPGLVTLTGTSAVMTAGTVTATTNPQVALYTITPPFAGNVTVNFGPTTSYGKQTWSVATPAGGGPVSIEVAGMLANTAYHLQAAVTLADGVTATDSDHTFTTTSYPANHYSADLPPPLLLGKRHNLESRLSNPIVAPRHIVATDLSGTVDLGLYRSRILGAARHRMRLSSCRTATFSFLFSVDSSRSPYWRYHPDSRIWCAKSTWLETRLSRSPWHSSTSTCRCELQRDPSYLPSRCDRLPNGHWLVLANTLKNVVLNGQTAPRSPRRCDRRSGHEPESCLGVE